MRPEKWREIDLGHEPPLTNERRLPAPRAIGYRWIAATILMGVAAAALLGGALSAALGRRAHFADLAVIAPRFLRQTATEAGRGDRLLDPAALQGSSHLAVRIEQLSETGFLRRFTRVSAQLARVAIAAKSGEDQQTASDSDKPDGGFTQTSELPAIIRFGTSHSPLPSSVSAYADDAVGTQIPMGQPLNVTVIPKSPVAHATVQHVVVARTEDTLSTILEALAVRPDEEAAVLAAFPRRRWFSSETVIGGDVVTVIEEHPPSAASPGHILKVVVERPHAGMAAVARTDDGRYQPIALDQAKSAPENNGSTLHGPDLRTSSGVTLRDSLEALAQSNHIDEGIVAELMRLCAHDFDLDRPVGLTDDAETLYAPNALGEPELVFVGLSAQGKSKRYYRFKARDDGSTDFYDADGRSITKFLLRKPVVDGRLGDGLGWRVHPILHDRRFHEGVDYAAPRGSPVAAAGAGVVEIIGWERGYGKYIRLRHDQGYETTYAHVSGFPKGLKVGDRVRQGETIAYVGSTGLSTGPHLYYEVWINGRRVNPLRIRLSGGRVLQGNMLKQFQQSAGQIDDLLDARADLTATR